MKPAAHCMPSVRTYKSISNRGYGAFMRRDYVAPNAADACTQALNDLAHAPARWIHVEAPSGEAWNLDRFAPASPTFHEGVQNEVRRALATGGGMNDPVLRSVEVPPKGSR